MPRTLSGARTLSAARRKVMHARASIFTDGTDDNATFTITAPGTGAHSLLCRMKPRIDGAASNHAALSIGANGAATATFLGLVDVGGVRHVGGGVVGTELYESDGWNQGRWRDAMVSFAGGVGGALKLYLDGAAPLSTVASPNIADTAGRIGSIKGAAGTWFGGLGYDALVYQREVTQAEFDLWRLDGVVPAGPHRRYTGDDGYGTTLTDSSGNGVNATMAGGALFSPDVPFRRSRKVEDVAAAVSTRIGAHRVTVGASDDLDPAAGDFGFMGWIYVPVVAATEMHFIERGDADDQPGILLYRDGGGFHLWTSDATTYRMTAAINNREVPFEWNHFAMCRDGDVCRLHINAGPPGTVTWPALNVTGAYVLSFGARSSGAYLSTGAMFNDWHFRKSGYKWDEIEADCFEGTEPAGSISWGMREGAGPTVHSSPAGYDGAITTPLWSTSTRCKARTAA